VELPAEAGIRRAVPAWSASGNERLAGTVRLWPHCLQGEGHYAAKLVKREPSPAWSGKLAASSAGRQPMAFFREFESRFLRGTALEGNFLLQGTQLFLLPDGCPELAGLRVVRPGLHLGELKKDRFEPNHALSHILPAEHFAHSFELLSLGE